ncbi:MAG: ATP-dependent RecD-like DNA helicase [Clostridium sp.]|nr:ATP-dependent RecD-like DNA helicase [Clostridium sp.]
METIKGYVEHVIYRNEENHYTVLELVVDGKATTVTGTFDSASEGETIEADGEFVKHAVYGKQFKASSYRSILPDDVVSMERYLGSGAVKGVGESLAARIVARFGEETFHIIEREPERLAEIKGISERKAREIAAQFEDKKGTRDAMMFLQKYGITNTMAVKIYQQYGAEIYGILQENPYRLAEEVDGIGFKAADEIAAKIGIHVDSDYRIRSGLLYVLLLAGGEGHLFLPLPVLRARTAELLGLSEEAVDPVIPNMAMDKKLVIKNQGGMAAVYGSSAYYTELDCARMLHDLMLAAEEDPKEDERLLSRIARIEEEQNLTLDERQRRAVIEAMKNGVFILSGGPGTGKTTTTKAIIELLDKEEMEFQLAAPTGRAAKRMQETTGYEARTIHRLLELNGALSERGGRVRFERNEENPLEADAVIIDEMSMVDIYLFHALLKAVTVGTRLILVGDANQLPSVGPGQVLRDLMESGCFPMVVLNKIFRQAEESDIVVNAHRIHEGREIALNNKSRDFFFLERDNVNVIYKHMIQLITGKMPAYVDAQPFEIQVLTPMRKGALGAESLNRILQQYLNPPSPDKKEYVFGENVFREGDKVMQIKNNYQLEWEVLGAYQIPVDRGTGIFNGDMGRVLSVDEAARILRVQFDEGRTVEYEFAHLEELELAYAITIHKSQGSEYPGIIMPLLSAPRMLLNRNLLYTGITRARGCVTILGSRQTIAQMIANVDEQKRNTGLTYRLRELIRKEDQ